MAAVSSTPGAHYHHQDENVFEIVKTGRHGVLLQ